MAVIRLTKSGSAVQFIDDDGRCYSTSATFILGLLSGKKVMPFVILSRMPFGVNPGRFPESPIWIPEGMTKEEVLNKMSSESGLRNANDALSIKATEEKKQEKAYTDSKVW
jgi:hypothetical protein